ncbi:MRN complex-interacting protein [Forsythia ovata]|uniref:MRN complex-interacting protein n=1 Tax=Forsythia ovata TaxID=205694 RepID=A0ABD1NWI4_9LAMI
MRDARVRIAQYADELHRGSVFPMLHHAGNFFTVKQKKKSGNKWTCVVCQEKQSVRKVFAQGFMAKDVRKFVQNFNMSRQLAEQKPEAKLFTENYDEEENKQIGEIGNQFQSNEGKKKKKTDWSEYVDYEENSGKLEKDELTEGDGFEPMIVTEMPKALFKKPKLSNHYAAGSDFEDGEKLLKPVFAKRNDMKRQSNYSRDVELVELQETTNRGTIKFQPLDRASKWSRFKVDIQEDSCNLASKGSVLNSSKYITPDDENFAFRAPPLNSYTTAKGPVSKWSNYMTENDDDDLLIREGKASPDQSSEKWKNDESNYQRVEEDIHPDFL